MSGQEIERLLSMIESDESLTRKEILAYIKANRENILAQLEEKGQAEIPVLGGERIILRRAA